VALRRRPEPGHAARKQAQALGSTPAALIAAAPDLRALQADFSLEAAAERDGLQWVKATPKNKDGQLQSVQVGFQGDALAALEILDSFGQRSVLKFSKVEVNPSLPAGVFDFKAPAGADVVKQ
jgi:outer membrane lipoprotein carrier protein